MMTLVQVLVAIVVIVVSAAVPIGIGALCHEVGTWQAYVLAIGGFSAFRVLLAHLMTGDG